MVKKQTGYHLIKSGFPVKENYSLRYGPDDDNQCDFDFWLANEAGALWYKELFYGARNPTWELDEFFWLLKPGDKILEIGCHHGFLTMMLANHVGPHGRVLSIDALPENAMVTQAQISLNQLHGRCQAFNYAAADRLGQIRIAMRTNSHVILQGEQTESILVEAVTGDWLDEKYGPFNVLKLDVEGFEVKVLAGCKNLLARRPKLLLELHPSQMKEFGYQNSLQQVYEQIDADQYEGTMVIRPDFERVLPFDISQVPEDRVSNVHLRCK